MASFWDVLEGGLGIIDYPRAALFKGLAQSLGLPTSTEPINPLSLQGRTFGSDIVRGTMGDAGYADEVLGFGLDVLGDPTNLIPVGAAVKGLGRLGRAARGPGRAAVTKEAVEAFGPRANQVMDVMDAYADTWAAARPGRNADDFYPTHIEAIRKAPDVRYVDEALQAEMPAFRKATLREQLGDILGGGVRSPMYQTGRQAATRGAAELAPEALQVGLTQPSIAKPLGAEALDVAAEMAPTQASMPRPAVDEGLTGQLQQMLEQSVRGADVGTEPYIPQAAREYAERATREPMPPPPPPEQAKYGAMGEQPIAEIEMAPGMVPREKALGSIKFGDDGRAVITAMKNADISTFVHETGHLFYKNLAEIDPQLMDEAAQGLRAMGVGNVVDDLGNITEEAHEAFARGFERYMRDGTAPTQGLARVFEKFKQWLTEIYSSIKGTDLEREVSPELRRVFDTMLGGGQQRPGAGIQSAFEAAAAGAGGAKVAGQAANPLLQRAGRAPETYLDIGHTTDQGKLWALSEGKIKSTPIGDEPSHMRWFQQLGDTPWLRGRIDDDAMQISIATPIGKQLGPVEQRQVKRAVDKLKKEYPGYEVWDFTEGRFQPKEMFQRAGGKSPFYSKAVDELENVPEKSLTKASLRGALKKLGVKDDELDWLNIAGMPSKFSRAEAAEYLGKNVPQLGETTYRGIPAGRTGTAQRAFTRTVMDDPQLREEARRSIQDLRMQETADDTLLSWDNIPPEKISDARLSELLEEEFNAATQGIPTMSGFQPQFAHRLRGMMDLGEGGATQFSDYKLPGASDSYRETVVQLPQNPQAYKSSHWNVENPLLHVRHTDRVDASGKKTLFVEEVQSDWHQAGRKKGYATPGNVETAAQVRRLLEDIGNKKRAAARNNNWKLADQLKRKEEKLIEIGGAAKVFGSAPPAPFEKSWPTLGIKRMIDEAVAKGYDSVSFPTGGTARMIQSGASDLVEGVPFAEVVQYGKDKPMTWYDNTLKAQVDKYAKQFGSKVRQTTINTPEGPAPAYQFDITPQMRQQVQGKGQTLFQRGQKPRHYMDIGHNPQHDAEMWIFDRGRIKSQPVTKGISEGGTHYDEFKGIKPEAMDNKIRGRVDHTDKQISVLVSPYAPLGTRKQVEKVVDKLAKQYQDKGYQLYVFGSPVLDEGEQMFQRGGAQNLAGMSKTKRAKEIAKVMGNLAAYGGGKRAVQNMMNPLFQEPEPEAQFYQMPYGPERQYLPMPQGPMPGPSSATPQRPLSPSRVPPLAYAEPPR